jgi:hypothetical protein
MTTTYEKDRHSRSSSETHIPDLERGDAKPEREEKDMEQDKVRVCTVTQVSDLFVLTFPQELQPTEEDFGTDLEKHLSRKSTKKDQLAPEKYPLSDLDNNLVGWE